MIGLAKLAMTKVEDKKVYAYLKKNYPADTLKWVKTAEWTAEEVPLDKIKMDRRPGGARETEKVKNIAAAFASGKAMEPVVLVKKMDGTYKIADGYHRTLGCKHSKKKTIKAWVGRVIQEDGPWDKEMHQRKLNIGKAAEKMSNDMEKVAVVGGIARLGGKMIKSTGKELKDFGKGITGLGSKGAKKNLNNTMQNPAATRTMIGDAKKGVRKEKINQAKSWGIAGVGATGAGINGVAKKMNEPESQIQNEQKQFDTLNPKF